MNSNRRGSNATFVAVAICLCAGVAEAGTWRAYEGNPVLGNEKLGTCFDVNVVTDGPAPYTMYFSWRPKKAIALVRSDDALTWTQEPEICLAADPTSGWETDLNRSCTVKKDGVWHMWYTGQAKDAKRGWMSRIGYATSTDGVHFTRVRRTPVMVPEFDFEKESVMNPYVRWDAKRGVWRMWYAAGETYEPNVLCYAESKDGLKWKKWDRNPMFGGAGGITWDRDRVGACEVYPLPDGRWAMFYIGYSDIDTARIGCAISKDGMTDWKRLDSNPLVAPDLCTWNGSACYKPSCIRDERNNRWMLWYNGRNGGPEYVGCAIHDGLDLEAPNAALPDTKELLKTYVRRFNRKDVELYTNEVSNAQTEDFMLANCPRFACPDKDIERTYYFRWWTFRKHLRKGKSKSEKGESAGEGWRITEFLPKVPWSGTDNTIVCPAGHHLREGRWLRDPKYATENARFWLADARATHRWGYSSWLFTGACGVAEVTGDDKLPVDLLDAAVAYYRRWEQGFERGGWPHAKTARMGGDGKGGFLSIDNHEGTEISLGGNGYKPLFASAMWSEANTIAKVAKAAGRDALAAEFAAKAETARRSLLAHCWNPAVGFFTTEATNGVKGVVRELHGYAPWYFGVPTDGRKPDWAQLTDPQGFAARYGLTFPERRAQGFMIDYKGHECKWNGPSWPFATSIALTALANGVRAEGLETEDVRRRESARYAALIWQYADAQRRTHLKAWEEPGGDWEVVPWIDENLNPDKAEWLSREIIRKTPEMAKRFPKERGKDYNHSTFCDLVISGLVGFVPNGAKGFTVDPLFPATWDYLVLEDLRYRGHDVDIRWQRGNGLVVEVDGQMKAQCPVLKRQEVAFGTELAPVGERRHHGQNQTIEQSNGCQTEKKADDGVTDDEAKLRRQIAAAALGRLEVKVPAGDKPDSGLSAVRVFDGLQALPIVYGTRLTDNLAAKYLRDCIREMTGIEPRLVSAAGAKDVKKAIFVIADNPPDSERFTTVVRDGAVRFTGAAHHAAYDFAERALGVRQYWPAKDGGRSVIRRERIEVREDSWSDAPFYRRRQNWPFDATEWGASFKPGDSLCQPMYVHAPQKWWDETNHNYKVTRPDIFQLTRNGKRNPPMLCYGNPKTLETYKERIVGEIERGEPSGGILSLRDKCITVSQWDGEVCCCCEHCKELYDRTSGFAGEASPLIWGHFTAQLSDWLKAKYPDWKIVILPYINTCGVPKDFAFTNGNVVAMLCTMPGLAMLKQADTKTHEEALIRRWHAATGNKVILWHYSCWPAESTAAPLLFGETASAHFRDCRDVVAGAFINGGWKPLGRQALSLYVTMKVLWNPDVDVHALYDEFAARMFGKAAKPMRELVRMQEAGWNRQWKVSQAANKNVYGISYPRHEVLIMQKLLAEAKKLAAGDRTVLKRIDYYEKECFERFFAESEAIASGTAFEPVKMKKIGSLPIVDGAVDEADWQKATPAKLYSAINKTYREARYPTELRMVWVPDEGVVFGFKCFDPDMPHARRGKVACLCNETVEMYLDPTGAGEGKYVQLLVDIDGNTLFYTEEGRWQPEGVKAAVKSYGDRWEVEVFLPFAALGRFANAQIPDAGAGGRLWVGNVTRLRYSNSTCSIATHMKDDRFELTRLWTRWSLYNNDQSAFGEFRFEE